MRAIAYLPPLEGPERVGLEGEPVAIRRLLRRIAAGERAGRVAGMQQSRDEVVNEAVVLVDRGGLPRRLERLGPAPRPQGLPGPAGVAPRRMVGLGLQERLTPAAQVPVGERLVRVEHRPLRHLDDDEIGRQLLDEVVGRLFEGEM